jgi:hypothetical protein
VDNQRSTKESHDRKKQKPGKLDTASTKLRKENGELREENEELRDEPNRRHHKIPELGERTPSTSDAAGTAPSTDSFQQTGYIEDLTAQHVETVSHEAGSSPASTAQNGQVDEISVDYPQDYDINMMRLSPEPAIGNSVQSTGAALESTASVLVIAQSVGVIGDGRSPRAPGQNMDGREQPPGGSSPGELSSAGLIEDLVLHSVPFVNGRPASAMPIANSRQQWASRADVLISRLNPFFDSANPATKAFASYNQHKKRHSSPCTFHGPRSHNSCLMDG